jgi:hypothetical protein
MPSGSERSTLADELSAAANSNGGWSYYPGKASRLEPTCWALLALGADGLADGKNVHGAFLSGCQGANGWLVEDPRWPINIGFNALTALTWLNRPALAAENKVQHLLAALVGSKGVQTPQTPVYRQDNSLQGWAWIDATFSWVEPTAWGALALKKGRRAGLVPDADSRARIAEAERLLVDRCCREGGWNFGNANVMGKDLFPHVPTTALALLALQDRREEDAVTRSVAFLESHWTDEVSMMALGLSIICLSVYGRPVDALESRLRAHVERHVQGGVPGANATTLNGGLHGAAVALTALTIKDNVALFRI